MALNNFSTDLFVVTVNGRQLSDCGETATPFTHQPIDAKSTLRRGQGGNALRLDRINPGESASAYLQPGSPDSAYLRGLMNSGANITMTSVQIGTLEAETGTEGMIVNRGSKGRGGATITDDQYDFEFNRWVGTAGGE